MARHSTSRLRPVARAIRSLPVRAILSLGVVLGFGAIGTLAYWTDSATLTGGEFKAGNLDIELAPSQTAFETTFKLANMEPGNSNAAIIKVKNLGSIDFVYTTEATAPGDLADDLRFRVVLGGTLQGSGKAVTCSAGGATFTLTGTPAVVLASHGLASLGEENICVEAKLPTGATGGQGESTTSQFVFKAKQVNAP